MRIVVQMDHPDIEDADVTEAVQMIYDALTASMDYGSGFLGIEEMVAIKHLADTAGFEAPPDLVDKAQELKRDAERVARLEAQYKLAPVRTFNTELYGQIVAE